jgi:SanA protein
MRKLQAIVLLVIIALFTTVAGTAYFIARNQSKLIYGNVDDVPDMPVAIVFGAGIGTPVLNDRVYTAVSLYKKGKVRKLLMTGDNSHLNYDEPQAMKTLAIAAGVPKEDVVCDYAGFRTYDSLYRAHNIFDVQKAILVTQRFHLPRAIFIARQLGLSVVGMDAALRSYGIEQIWYELREILATEYAWLDVAIQRKPKFLGKKESLY